DQLRDYSVRLGGRLLELKMSRVRDDRHVESLGDRGRDSAPHVADQLVDELAAPGGVGGHAIEGPPGGDCRLMSGGDADSRGGLDIVAELLEALEAAVVEHDDEFGGPDRLPVPARLVRLDRFRASEEAVLRRDLLVVDDHRAAAQRRKKLVEGDLA